VAVVVMAVVAMVGMVGTVDMAVIMVGITAAGGVAGVVGRTTAGAAGAAGVGRTMVTAGTGRGSSSRRTPFRTGARRASSSTGIADACTTCSARTDTARGSQSFLFCDPLEAPRGRGVRGSDVRLPMTTDRRSTRRRSSYRIFSEQYRCLTEPHLQNGLSLVCKVKTSVIVKGSRLAESASARTP